MKVKQRWSDSDFTDMGWHDCRLYSLAIPDEDFRLSLDIDYIFKWQSTHSSTDGFWVSPCDLNFNSVSNFKVDLDFENNMLLFIENINRSNERASPNGNSTLWDFEIECDNGLISFSATGFEQNIRKQPILSDTQDLGTDRQSIFQNC